MDVGIIAQKDNDSAAGMPIRKVNLGEIGFLSSVSHVYTVVTVRAAVERFHKGVRHHWATIGSNRIMNPKPLAGLLAALVGAALFAAASGVHTVLCLIGGPEGCRSDPDSYRSVAVLVVVGAGLVLVCGGDARRES